MIGSRDAGRRGPAARTTAGQRPALPSSSEVPLGFQQLGIQDSGSSSSADGVVGQYRELPVENAARAKPSNRRGHASTHIDVETRLWTVIGLEVDDRLLGSTRQLEFLRFGLVAVPCGDDFFRLRFLLQANRD